MSSHAHVLTVENLDIAYRVRGRDLEVLHNLSFHIGRGEAYGLVGESGCGKSTAALAVVRYLPPNGRILGGRILIGDLDLFALGREAIRRLRATTMSMVYQDPARALNPSIQVGEQIAEIFRLQGLTAAQSSDRAAAMLERVRIADGSSVYKRYPHQLSGGMQQRVAIAMAVSINPQLLILDEPTTGLDATVEAEILDLIGHLRSEFATSILFISHNLAVVSRMCDRVGVLYAGALIEEGPTAGIFGDPRHPYTVGLLRCLPRHGQRKGHGRLDSIPGNPPTPDDDMGGCLFAPRCGLADEQCVTHAPPFFDLGNRFSRCHFHQRAQALASTPADDRPAAIPIDRNYPPILRAIGVSKTFGSIHPVRVLHAVSLQLWRGETLGLVGESGSGKTTLARLLLGLVAPDPGGVVELDGAALGHGSRTRSPSQLKSLQIVFQNPDSALNRSHSIRRLISRVLARLARVPKPARLGRLLELTRSVRLADRYLDLRPRQLSGGLKQRVAIARAFAGEPRIVVCDEPTSALDVSVQAAILNLLTELQAKHQVSYLFISHDLNTVRYVSDRIAVLYLGRLMEIGPAERIFSGPHHPYTAALLSAMPSVGGKTLRRACLDGEIPSAIHSPAGCVFHTRCPRKLGAVCEEQEPPLHPGAEAGHQIRCHIPVADLERPEPV
ncbi:MAG TPA: ABC transporter ATP-binding protein [Steroidobacteraceae bacterium]|nr:ABC transporter ATP-binding protein [Steroidobacteraceae bacterium]